MYKLIFYENEKGISPIGNFISVLDSSNAPYSRIIMRKIYTRFDMLENMGTRSTYVEHIRGKVWQLKIGKYRILFFNGKENEIVLLHCFFKKTRKTPKKHINRAEKEIIDWRNNNR